MNVSMGFTPLQTYKVLKLRRQTQLPDVSFTPLQTYKVLKPKEVHEFIQAVLHHYKLTRFSNALEETIGSIKVLHHYKLTRFSNSKKRTIRIEQSFTPLQTYKVLKPQMRLSPSQTYWLICVSYLVMYKTHVFIY